MSLWAPPIPTPILPVWGGGRKTGGNSQFQGQIVVPTPSWQCGQGTPSTSMIWNDRQIGGPPISRTPNTPTPEGVPMLDLDVLQLNQIRSCRPQGCNCQFVGAPGRIASIIKRGARVQTIECVHGSCRFRALHASLAPVHSCKYQLRRPACTS